jgi:hypothetical protein
MQNAHVRVTAEDQKCFYFSRVKKTVDLSAVIQNDIAIRVDLDSRVL